MLDAEDIRIIQFIRDKGERTRTEIQKEIGLSSSTAIRRINKLKAFGAIVASDKGKNVKYSEKKQ